MTSNLTRIAFAFLLSSLLSSNVSAAPSYVLSKGKVQSVQLDGVKRLCGSPNSKWVPVKKSAGTTYVAFKKATPEHKAACSAIIPRACLKSLSQLPDVSDMTKASDLGASHHGHRLSAMAVSGDAPVIPDVPSLDPTSLFWRAGLIDAINGGSPTQDQCNEFWGSPVDGESAGQTACYMLQDVGYAIGEIQQAGTSLCYFKNIPNSTAFSSGAAQIVRGSAPAGGVRKLFDTPEGSRSRIIKVSMDGESSDMYIKISSRGENNAAGNLYRFDLWDCAENEIISRESGVVKLSGDYIATSLNLNEGQAYTGTVRGFLKFEEGDITFDNARTRYATSRSVGDDERRLSEIQVTAENRIISKQRAVRLEEIQKSYSVSTFSGTSVADLRFLSGGSQMSFERESGSDTFVGASEFRDTGYASSPNSEEASLVSAFSFDGDSFYAGDIEESSPNLSGISCSPRVDIEMSLDMQSEVMGAIQEECEGTRIDGFDMCRSEALDEAAHNFQQYCMEPEL